jgi:hypothetical protein
LYVNAKKRRKVLTAISIVFASSFFPFFVDLQDLLLMFWSINVKPNENSPSRKENVKEEILNGWKRKVNDKAGQNLRTKSNRGSREMLK